VVTNVAQTAERRFGYSNGAWLVMSPSGTRLAVQVSGPLEDAGAQEAAPQAAVVLASTTEPESVLLPTGLHVVDLVSGETTMLSDEVKAAFFWSPDGERLLVLDLELGDSGTTLTRWEVWTDDEVRRGPLFSPSLQTVREYLPFFDQYAQSVSFWSPSGDRFVYAGTAADGQAGIWVASADDPGRPELVSTGTIAVWSPT
jgi:TolB protein